MSALEERLKQAEQRETTLSARVAQYSDMVEQLRSDNNRLQEQLLDLKQTSASALTLVEKRCENEISLLTQKVQRLEADVADAQAREVQLQVQVDVARLKVQL